MKFDILLGKTITSITGLEVGSDDARIFTSDGNEYRLYHSQDCCESVSIDDVLGDINDLIGYPITIAEESTNSDDAKFIEWEDEDEPDGKYKSYDESHTWTFYKLATIKGYVDIKWYGSSNGYYSERVDFVQEGTQNEYGWYPD